jgi:hypothetical protein
MKKYIFVIFLATFLSGCDKLNDIVGRVKEKSPWVYSEETDKLNNTKMFVAKKNYKNKEGTVQADTEFQCDSRKELWLQITTFEANPVNGKLPGTALILNKGETKITSAFEYIKTRNGDAKIALYAIADENYENSAKLLLSGFNLDELKRTGGQGLGLAVLIDELSAVLRNQGYVLAADKKEISKLFKNKDWIVEIPTQNGVVIAEIDLSNPTIQKVFDACSWKPEFLNAVAPAAAPQASVATQQQIPLQPAAPAAEVKKVTPNECFDAWYQKARNAAIKDEAARGNKGPYAETDLVPLGARLGAESDCGVNN